MGGCGKLWQTHNFLRHSDEDVALTSDAVGMWVLGDSSRGRLFEDLIPSAEHQGQPDLYSVLVR